MSVGAWLSLVLRLIPRLVHQPCLDRRSRADAADKRQRGCSGSVGPMRPMPRAKCVRVRALSSVFDRDDSDQVLLLAGDAMCDDSPHDAFPAFLLAVAALLLLIARWLGPMAARVSASAGTGAGDAMNNAPFCDVVLAFLPIVAGGSERLRYCRKPPGLADIGTSKENIEVHCLPIFIS